MNSKSFIIIEAQSKDELEDAVIEKLAEGYEPLTTFTISEVEPPYDTKSIWYQSMRKKEPNNVTSSLLDKLLGRSSNA